VERPFAAYKGDEPYVFVSYSHDDAALVYPELERLKDAGFNVWYDEGINPGSTWRDEVALALTQCKVFLYFITPRSVASSNCLKEVNFSLSRERKILAVHLESTKLPIGLELSLSDMQAIVKADLGEVAYRTKMIDALRGLLPPTSIVTDAAPTVDEESAGESKSIAVLPLVNRNLDAADDYLCDGIAEELINGLGKLEGLRVASQTASFRFRGGDVDLKAIGGALGVGSILSGSLQRAGGRLRINVRLEAVDGALLWSNRYDGDMDDIFALQDDVARQVVEALKVEFASDGKQTLIDIGTRNVAAYNAYLHGIHLRRQGTLRGHHQAKAQFETALELDPGFEQANVEAAANLFFGRILTPAWRDEAAERFYRAERAGLLQRPAEAFIREMFPDRCPPPVELAREAIDKLRAGDPAWATFAYWQLGDVLTMVGALRGALSFFHRYRAEARESIGENVRVDQWECFILAALGEFQAAIDLWTRRIEATPEPLWVGDRLLLYIRTGQYDKARAELDKVNAIWPRNFPQFYDLYWRREIDAAKAYWAWLGERGGLMPSLKVWGFALVGDMERSLDHLEEQFQSEAPLLVHVQTRRVLPTSVVREVERHPRYRALLTRLGIDDEARAKVLELVNGASDLTGIRVAADEPA